MCHQFLFDNPGQVITKFQFSKLFAQAWSKAMTFTNIVSGFRGAGIYPFSLSMILDKFPTQGTVYHLIHYICCQRKIHCTYKVILSLEKSLAIVLCHLPGERVPYLYRYEIHCSARTVSS